MHLCIWDFLLASLLLFAISAIEINMPYFLQILKTLVIIIINLGGYSIGGTLVLGCMQIREGGQTFEIFRGLYKCMRHYSRKNEKCYKKCNQYK